MRLRKKNLVWLTMLGALVMIAVLSGIATAPVAITLIALYAVALGASVLEIQPERLIDRSRSSLTMMRMSSEAREAVERAQRRGSYFASGLTLLDVGLITTQAGQEGIVMRRARSVSKDDVGLRPFISLHVQPENADRTAVIRFEIIDHNGDQQYIHEMRTYLHDGEMNILTDHHLPLEDNARITGAGDWDLRVYIDSVLMGAHNFTLAPSLRERYEHFERSAAKLSDERPDADIPLSLEDLLRSRSQDQRSR
jgi:hypothetical protein